MQEHSSLERKLIASVDALKQLRLQLTDAKSREILAEVICNLEALLNQNQFQPPSKHPDHQLVEVLLHELRNILFGLEPVLSIGQSATENLPPGFWIALYHQLEDLLLLSEFVLVEYEHAGEARDSPRAAWPEWMASEWFEPKKLIDYQVQSGGVRLKNHQISWVNNCLPLENLLVWGKPSLLRMCLQNLLNNAAKHAPNSTVLLSASLERSGENSIALHLQIDQWLNPMTHTPPIPGKWNNSWGIGLKMIRKMLESYGGYFQYPLEWKEHSAIRLQFPVEQIEGSFPAKGIAPDVAMVGFFQEQSYPALSNLQRLPFQASDRIERVLKDLQLGKNFRAVLVDLDKLPLSWPQLLPRLLEVGNLDVIGWSHSPERYQHLKGLEVRPKPAILQASLLAQPANNEETVTKSFEPYSAEAPTLSLAADRQPVYDKLSPDQSLEPAPEAFNPVRPKVGLVEDNALARIWMRYTFENHNSQVFELPTGLEAIRFLQSQQLDLIVLDLHLPDLKAHYLLDVIEQLSPAPKLLLVSGEDLSSQQKQQLQRQNLQIEFRLKPLRKHEIAAVVDELNTTIPAEKARHSTLEHDLETMALKLNERLAQRALVQAHSWVEQLEQNTVAEFWNDQQEILAKLVLDSPESPHPFTRLKQLNRIQLKQFFLYLSRLAQSPSDSL